MASADDRKKHVDVPIVESVVCAKAMRFANLLNKLDFKASKDDLLIGKIVMD